MKTVLLLIWGVIVALLPVNAMAQDRVILTITLPDRVVEMSAHDLSALPVTEFETSTIWTEGVQQFRGVRMVALLEHLGVDSGTLELTAANDYSITIPIADFHPDGAVLAYERNGKPMTLRSKGPLWLVYPYDSASSFQTEVIYANSIWQLDRMAVKD
ncbi:molybdopterin-dependent oxidoreductase [Pseudooceanicola sp. HF7]|uniref:molybdopterin-dependent oxidoreductase n=1 Tax=Pseudooceanicola sp. HF7 TaxID=2721560 RepID=UPI0014302290|nr:molybdopterin-dependent oxidoreductase [Pseudooceanicola sp. HF7]NIZ08696.1 molybdopterin-dependent oxidoreductase [Pseudooceanicola sp. HF7]